MENPKLDESYSNFATALDDEGWQTASSTVNQEKDAQNSKTVGTDSTEEKLQAVKRVVQKSEALCDRLFPEMYSLCQIDLVFNHYAMHFIGVMNQDMKELRIDACTQTTDAEEASASEDVTNVPSSTRKNCKSCCTIL